MNACLTHPDHIGLLHAGLLASGKGTNLLSLNPLFVLKWVTHLGGCARRVRRPAGPPVTPKGVFCFSLLCMLLGDLV